MNATTPSTYIPLSTLHLKTSHQPTYASSSSPSSLCPFLKPSRCAGTRILSHLKGPSCATHYPPTPQPLRTRPRAARQTWHDEIRLSRHWVPAEAALAALPAALEDDDVHWDTETAEGVGRHATIIRVLGVHFWRWLLSVRVG